MIPTAYINQIKRMVSNEYSGRVLYITISGSHLYGFESKDSDIDYRGCWIIDTNKIIGLDDPRDYIERPDGNNDVVLYELKKELSLLNAGNCNVLEHLFAKQLYTSDEYFDIKKMVQLNLNMSGVYNSYRGMAWANYNKFCLKGMHTVKKFLYVFRAILAGIHCIETRTIEPNIVTLLNEKAGKNDYYDPLMKLVELKKQGLENDFLPDKQLPVYHKLVESMMTNIDVVYENSRVSEKMKIDLDRTRHDLFNQYIKRVRKNYIRKNEK